MSQLLIRNVLFIFITVTTTRADILTLSNGETLEVLIIDKNDTSVHVVHPILGELHIAPENIGSVEVTTPNKSPAETISEDNTTELINDEPTWNQTIKLGAGYQTGQTINVDISTPYHADKTVNEHEVVFGLSYRIAKTDGTKNANRFSGAWENKWFRSDSK